MRETHPKLLKVAQDMLQLLKYFESFGGLW